MADDNKQPTADASDVMVAVDSVLEPLRRMAAAPQPMNTAQLSTVAACIRQALAIVVYGPPPVHETVVEDPNAVAAASLVPGSSEPQFPAADETQTDEADETQPDDGTACEDEPAA